MSSDSVILIAPPFITAGVNNWVIFPPNPIESDMVYHLRTSFQQYHKIPLFEPKWSLADFVVTAYFHKDVASCIAPYDPKQQEKFELKELTPIDVDFDSIDECFEQASQISETINFLFLWNIEPHLSPNTIHIFNKIKSYRKKGKEVRVISIIPDAWPRGEDLFNLISSHIVVSDKTVVLYEEMIPYLLANKRKDLADELSYFPCSSMVLNKTTMEDKTTDFCFIGPIGLGREHRGVALELMRTSLPDKSFFVYTEGKTTKPDNYLSATKDYLNKVAESRFSILTATMPASFLNDAEKSYKQWKSVLPARFAESIINMTVPVYVQFSKNDRLPKVIDDYEACVYIQANDSPDTIRQKIESVSFEKMKDNMMNLYNDHISPNVLIPKLLERT